MKLVNKQAQFDANASTGYNRGMQTIHWVTLALMVGVYAAALSIDRAADPAWYLMLHRSFGVSIMIVTIARLVWRQRSRVPDLPSDLLVMQKLAAKPNMMALYALLFSQPALGIMESELHGDRIVLFGAITIPALIKPDRSLAHSFLEVHEWCAYALLALIGMHVGATLYHHFIRRDDVLSGMLPRIAQSNHISG
jgi:cytochrome b561